MLKAAPAVAPACATTAVTGAATAGRLQTLEALRLQIGRIERRGLHKATRSLSLRFGIDAIDDILPHDGLGRRGLAGGALHEVLGQGADSEYGTLPSLLVGGLLAGSSVAGNEGQILWAMRGHDLFAPALSAVGLHPDRLILVECGNAVLDVMEEALRHPGMFGVVGEVDGRLGLNASRRLQLAAEASGAIGLLIRRSRNFDDPALLAPTVAASRWRVGVLPRPASHQLARQPSAHHPEPELGPALWRLELLRLRGAGAGLALPIHWTLEACHDKQAWHQTGRLSLAAALADRSPVPELRHSGVSLRTA